MGDDDPWLLRAWLHGLPPQVAGFASSLSNLLSVAGGKPPLLAAFYLLIAWARWARGASRLLTFVVDGRSQEQFQKYRNNYKVLNSLELTNACITIKSDRFKC
jgi:hypothetical protein